MAGTFPRRGGAERFRNGIRTAMEMAAPPEVERRVTFLFAPQLVYNVPTDDTNVPFDPGATVVETPTPSKTVPCAVEFYNAVGELLPFGASFASRVKLLLLDQDYEQVKDAIAVMIDGDRYDYEKTQPPSGLFSVGIFEVWFAAVNEG